MSSLGNKIREAMKTPPFRFQIRGVRFLERRNGRGLIGDEMGAGKSYQTVTYYKIHPELRPLVLVCPSTLKYNWQREFKKHAGLDTEVAEGRTVEPLDGDIWIINYDILQFWVEWFRKQKVKAVVFDESQKLQSRKSRRTIASQALARGTPSVICLSGTPITNRPVEFFPTLNMIAPEDFPSFQEYAFRYCGPRRGFMGRGWNFRGASNLKELHEKVAPHMIRRKIEDVMPDLPLLTRTIIPLKIPMREYERAKNEFIAWLTSVEGAEVAKRAAGAESLVRLGHLKKLAALGKMDAFVEWVKDFQESIFKPKLVIFGIHHAIINTLLEHFPDAVVITGEVTNKERTLAVDKFQNDPKCTLLIGNLIAAGVGLTLTAASTTAFIEVDWVPADHDQAERRVLRIGQTARHVDAYYFIAKGTIEEKILEIHEAKRSVVGQILDGKEVQNVHTRIIESLIHQRKK